MLTFLSQLCILQTSQTNPNLFKAPSSLRKWDIFVLQEERRQKILGLTAERGRARTSDLAEMFGVSEMTVHRDIQQLESQGLVRKLHGGVAHIGVEETPYRDRIVQQHREKQAIARAAAKLVQPGWTIYLSPGTTNTELARALPREGVTVVTNSLPIAQELMQTTELEVVLTGGIVRRHAEALVGAAAEASLASIYLNLAFIGVTGLDEVAGLTVYSQSEALVLQQVMRSARKTVVVSDSSKWGKVMGPIVAPLSKFHVLISDTGLPKAAIKFLKNLDIQVIQAEVSA
jgi:DeoR/GlpR family transcriptional regulator of sugar metabolism